MIKFVCASCGERLSVSDQHAGRKGACPNCQAVNRIPLKGYIETAGSKAPTVSAPAAAAPVVERPSVGDTRAVGAGAGFNAMPNAPAASDEPVELDRFGTFRLPLAVKVALLVLAALGIVAALYFALLLALHAVIPRQ